MGLFYRSWLVREDDEIQLRTRESNQVAKLVDHTCECISRILVKLHKLSRNAYTEGKQVFERCNREKTNHSLQTICCGVGRKAQAKAHKCSQGRWPVKSATFLLQLRRMLNLMQM